MSDAPIDTHVKGAVYTMPDLEDGDRIHGEGSSGTKLTQLSKDGGHDMCSCGLLNSANKYFTITCKRPIKVLVYQIVANFILY